MFCAVVIIVRESSVERHLVSALKKRGYLCLKFDPTNRIGMPDRLVLLPNGRCVWAELKTDNGKLSEIQKFRHDELRKLGQRVFVVWDTAQADRLAGEIEKEEND